VTKLSLNRIIQGNWKIILTLALILLAGWQLFSSKINSSISKQEAIDTAIEIASMSRPEISGAQITPYNIILERMTLAKAVKHINSSNGVAAGYDPDMTVWFVQMEGIWSDEFPRPQGFPTPVPYHHYAVILDANTGLDIEVSASP
jgi:hypothetical protein